MIDGITFEADSPEEALSAAREMKVLAGATESREPQRNGTAPRRRRGGPEDILQENVARSGDESEMYRTFWLTVNHNGEKIVGALIEHPGGLTTDSLASETQIAAVSLPPMIKHIRTTAARCGLDPEEFLKRDLVSVAGEPKSLYKLSENTIKNLKERTDR
jgi:proteasome lid subunit RPN8/RPN11